MPLDDYIGHPASSGINQGWEFDHLISERSARILPKNERMSDWLKKMSDSLIRSFPLSDVSKSLILLKSNERFEAIAHGLSFLVSDLSDLLTSLIWFEQNERFAHNAQRKWAIEGESLTSLTKKEEMSNSLIFK